MEDTKWNDMLNNEIAKIIGDIGNMLEILNDNPYKIAAYQRASRTIEMDTRSFEDLYRQKGEAGLKEIRGIGESISSKIAEIIKTGKCKYYQELLKKVPAPIIKFSEIPGVGPKTAKKLYDIFKVDKIKELESILKTDKHSDLIQTKTRENILQGIKILAHQSGRMLISFAEPIAQEIIRELKTYKEISQADAVGSLRRMKETVGDIDIVAALKPTTNNPQLSTSKKIIDKFIQSTFVERVIAEGDTKTTIIHKSGPQIDLEILPQNQYGSLLQHFTGSKDHNITLRSWAEKHGFSISEHGIKITQNAKRKTQNNSLKFKTKKCKTEKEVYKTLGMDYIEPELRENRGEIEAAQKQQLPNLVELSDIKGDLQMHSTYSDGTATIREMALACKNFNYQYIAITDHSKGLGITHGIGNLEIKRIRSEIDRLKKENLGIKILFGVETNIKPDGKIDLDNSLLKEFEIILASIHSSFRQSKEITTERLIKAIQNPFVNIIAHPTGRIIDRRPEIDADWQKVFRVAAKNRVALEINSFSDRLDLNDSMIIEAKKYGCKFVINTDSHRPDHLVQMRYGVAQARRGWLEKKDILNTLSLDKLLRWFGK